MLSGKTSVFIDTRKSDDDGDLVKTDDDIASKTVTEGNDVMSEDSHESHQEVKKKKSLDRSKYGKFIIHFGKRKFVKFDPETFCVYFFFILSEFIQRI
jgi:hypothetical protein